MSTDELDIIVQADDLPTSVGLDVPLCDLAGLIVEETVGVSTPCHTPHVHSKCVSLSKALTRISAM